MTNPYSGGSGGPPSFTPLPTGLGLGSLRRPSYATVAAGTAANRPPTFGRSGSFSSTAQQLPGEQQPQAVMAHTRQPSRAMDIDGAGAYGGAGRAGAWSRDRLGCPQHEDHPPFFTPSYLRQSRHVQRLRRAYDEHVSELQEHARMSPPEPPPLSTWSSVNSLHKMHASHLHHHRPAVKDVIERLPPPSEEDRSHPLPSRWSEDDRMSGLEILAEGTEVRFGGVTKTSDEAASIRSDYPMPRECGLYYFEVTIISRGKDGMIGIGFSGRKANLNRLPGWETDSWAYHGDDGYSFACTASGKAYGPRYASQDTIGCGVNFRTGNAFFTKNGVYLGKPILRSQMVQDEMLIRSTGVAFTGVRSHGLYPSIGIKKPGEHLRINFGRTPFVFDINRIMDQERQAIMNEINRADVSLLHPPDDENTLIHKLIGQYLAHEGYVETAKAFSRDVHEQQRSLSTDPEALQARDSDDDIHAINRQKIRKSILDGDIDRALKYTSSYYPHVLEEERNKDIYFRLRCRKFIEMMRRYTELATATSSPVAMTKSVDSLASNGHPDGAPLMAEVGDGEDGQDTQMELDDQLHREASKGLEPPPTDDIDMDASQELPLKASFMKQGDLLGATLSYGQELQQEFGGDPRLQIKKQLTELFAIIAYPNPADSPIGGLLDQSGRVQIAEEVNGAILVSLGKPSSAALEKLCAQTEALLDETAGKTGGAAAFINVRTDFLQA
ncbi:hypothetical protein LTR85_005463 [Meristemomyces frigidus]|nr:hypothetical protein LTR85_005463 [Meristemomyces frigidus]